jgi:hypothetical protein
LSPVTRGLDIGFVWVKDNMGKEKQLIFQHCFLILFFGSFLIWSFFDMHIDDDIRLALDGKNAVGQVVGVQYHSPMYNFNYSFTVENKIYTGSSRLDREPGDSISVSYLPANPNIHSAKLEGFPVSYGILLIVLLLVVIWSFRVARLLKKINQG